MCRRLAWSKTGSIARIVSDGSKITFQAVVRSPDTGIWSLSDESPQPIIAPENVFFQHLEWSNLGLDLVALDQNGCPHLYAIAFALDRLQPHTVHLKNGTDDLSAAVGLHWLPLHPSQSKVPRIQPSPIFDR